MRINKKSRFASQIGLSQTDVLVLSVGLLVLGALVWLMINQGRAKSQSSVCKNNLKQISLGMQLFRLDHGDAAVTGNLTNELGANVPPPSLEELSKALQRVPTPRLLFLCPADAEAMQPGPDQPAGPTVSYFVSAEASPPAWVLLAGDRNLSRDGRVVPPGIFDLSTNSVVGWTAQMHRFKGNVAMSDGSAQEMNVAKLAEYLRRVGKPQSLVIP